MPAETAESVTRPRPGRPSPYEGREFEIVDAIAEKLCAGTPMAVILRENGMPSEDTIEVWRANDPEINRIIARARKIGFDAIAAECLAIADDTSRDTIETKNGEIPNTEWIARSKLRVWTRLQLLSKWDRERYGDAGPVVNVGVNVEVADFWKKLRGGEPVETLNAESAQTLTDSEQSEAGNGSRSP